MPDSKTSLTKIGQGVSKILEKVNTIEEVVTELKEKIK